MRELGISARIDELPILVLLIHEVTAFRFHFFDIVHTQ